MAVLSKGETFATGDQVTALKLNDLVDDATFVAGAVDNVSTQLSSGAIIVKDSGVTTAKINDGSVTTAKIVDANVTKAKIENLSDYTVLGNVSGGAAAPEEVSLLDEDDMASDSDTAIATQQSVKAYVDEYAMKYSGATGTLNIVEAVQDLDLSSTVGTNRALVIMEVWSGTTARNVFFRAKNSETEPYDGVNTAGWGSSSTVVGPAYQGGTIVVATNASGVVQHKATGGSVNNVEYKIISYQKLA